MYFSYWRNNVSLVEAWKMYRLENTSHGITTGGIVLTTAIAGILLCMVTNGYINTSQDITQQHMVSGSKMFYLN